MAASFFERVATTPGGTTQHRTVGPPSLAIPKSVISWPIKSDKSFAHGAVEDYLSTFAENLEAFRIEPEGEDFDDRVVENVESFLPYRDELIDLFLAIARYRADPEMYRAVHAFFERILAYEFWPAGHSTWRDTNADNFKFILRKIFPVRDRRLAQKQQVCESQ